MLRPMLCLQVHELRQLVAASGREYPVPKIPERKLKAMEREAAKAAAIAEQEREAAALAEIEAGKVADGAAAAGVVSSNRQQAGLQPTGASSGKLQCAVAAGVGQTAAAAGVEPGSGNPSSPAAKRQAVDSMACC